MICARASFVASSMPSRNVSRSVVPTGLLLALAGAVLACAGQNQANSPPLAGSRPADASPALPDAGRGAEQEVTEAHPASKSNIPLPGQRTAFLTALEKAPAATEAFARSSGQAAALAAGDALATLADALEALPDHDQKLARTSSRSDSKQNDCVAPSAFRLASRSGSRRA